MENRFFAPIFGLLAISLAFNMFSNSASAAIFGRDDRQTVLPSSKIQPLARATAIALLSGNETMTADGKLDMTVDVMSNFMCKDEKFASDPTLSYSCTGFLVGPDLIATAGHCLANTGHSEHETEGYCKVYDWLFDYQTQNDRPAQTSAIDMKNVYHCKQIIYAINDSENPMLDFALVQLDRPVLDRKPLVISKAPVHVGESVFMIGYPFGMPVKLTDNAKIIENVDGKSTFMTRLDAFDGNSGSPVFNDQNEVIGILVSGRPSDNIVEDKQNKCSRWTHCDEDGTHCTAVDQFAPTPGFETIGSDVQRIAPLLEKIPR